MLFPVFLVRLSAQSDDILGGLPVGIALLRCLRFRSCANPPDASGVPMFVFFRSMVVYGFRIAAPAEHRIASSKVTGLKYSWISDDHVTDENIYLGCCGALVRRCDLVGSPETFRWRKPAVPVLLLIGWLTKLIAVCRL